MGRTTRFIVGTYIFEFYLVEILMIYFISTGMFFRRVFYNLYNSSFQKCMNVVKNLSILLLFSRKYKDIIHFKRTEIFNKKPRINLCYRTTLFSNSRIKILTVKQLSISEGVSYNKVWEYPFEKSYFGSQ